MSTQGAPDRFARCDGLSNRSSATLIAVFLEKIIGGLFQSPVAMLTEPLAVQLDRKGAFALEYVDGPSNSSLRAGAASYGHSPARLLILRLAIRDAIGRASMLKLFRESGKTFLMSGTIWRIAC